jgi:hypothetical protein
VFGNVASVTKFRVGMEDAVYLVKEFLPTFDGLDLVNLPNFHIYLKLMIDEVTSQPFSAITLPFKNDVISNVLTLRLASELSYYHRKACAPLYCLNLQNSGPRLRRMHKL